MARFKGPHTVSTLETRTKKFPFTVAINDNAWNSHSSLFTHHTRYFVMYFHLPTYTAYLHTKNMPKLRLMRCFNKRILPFGYDIQVCASEQSDAAWHR